MRAKLFKCEDSDFVCKTDTKLGKHIDKIHEGWRITQHFFDYFCSVEHNIHICQSNEDFHEGWRISLDLAFGKTYTSMESKTVLNALDVKKWMMMMIR